MSSLIKLKAVTAGCSLICSRPVICLPVRNIVNYKYVTKKKRRDAQRETSISWAKPLIEEYEKKSSATIEQKPPEEPHMLHLVYLEKSTRGRPWWEKKIVADLELDGKLHQPVVLKNVPSVNKLLDEIKHLVRIMPLRFPHGIPEHESDFNHVVLRSNGEMIVKKKLQPSETAESSGQDCASSDKWKLNHNTISKELEDQLRSYSVHSEYFKAKYVYRRNQDGKEYRYTFNKDTPKYEW